MKYIKEYNEYLNDNFKKWFGNSKVVDENGNPLVVYHGTNKDFDTFKSTKFTTSGYFARDPKLASHISKLIGDASSVVPVYLSIQNPLDLSDITTGYDDISPSELILKLPFEIDEHFKEKLMKYHPNPLFTYLGDVDFLEQIKNAGYDGIIFHELTPEQTNIKTDNGMYKTFDLDSGITYIAFKPEQIKSALGNNGNFNPNSKNISEKANTDGYIYHGTGKGQALNIQRDGYMKPNRTGEEQPSISFTNDLDYAKYYAKSKGVSKMCILRTKLTDDFQLSPRIINNKGDEYITFKNVPSSDLEVMTVGGWHPLDTWNVIFDEPRVN